MARTRFPRADSQTETPAPPLWASYARAGDMQQVRAQLAELRAYVEGEAEGRVHVECSDVGRPDVGLEALLALARAGVADRILVKDAPRLGRQLHVIRELDETPARLFFLDAIRVAGTAMPVDLEEQLRELFGGWARGRSGAQAGT